MQIIGIILIIFSILLLFLAFIKLKKAKQLTTQHFNKQQQHLQHIKQQLQQTEKQINLYQGQLNVITNSIQIRNKQLQTLTKIVESTQKQIDEEYDNKIQKVKARVKEFETLTENGLKNYCANLQEVYKVADAAHAQKISKLEQEYTEAAADLQKLKDTRKAAFEAVLKEQQIKANQDNYRLLPSKTDLQDIHTLEHIKQTLHKPRILSMLIWQTYWQPIAKKQFPLILQEKTKTGIYKITNLSTNQCYIGQAVDIYKRWCQHCKAGLGIDTPGGNKLYKAIQKDGLQNFTFELLLECPQEQLNEKEHYFIEFYQSDLYGYNGNIGVKK